MSKNCRFAFAVHVAAVLALTPDQPCTSDWLAGSVNTNPVVIRRILSTLAKAGLVRSVRGSQGGTMLSRPPEAITLLEISRAVDDDEPVALHPQTPNPDCPVGASIVPVLREVITRADAARAAVLDQTRLSDVVTAIQSNGNCEMGPGGVPLFLL